MQKWTLTLLILLTSFASRSYAQTYEERVQKYIYMHKALAMAEQRRSGVPAAITLSQGVLETQAGESVLCTDANNHFGIKCKKEWQGETFAHTDDAPNECFRKYGCVNDSYKDHSDYLKSGPRYASLFLLEPTDYKGWCTGLKRCGYATNPKYAQKLIDIIEHFNLQTYTTAAINDLGVPGENERAAMEAQYASYTSPVAADSPTTEVKKVNTTTAKPGETWNAADVPAGVQQINGMRAFYAHKGDVLLEPAIKYNVRYAKLLEWNDLPDAPLEADMYVYLEKKKAKGIRQKHPVKQNETLLQIAQAEGIQLKQLRLLNMLDQGDEPAEGTSLYLQESTNRKPAIRQSAKKGMVVSSEPVLRKPVKEDYVAMDKPEKVAERTAQDPVIASSEREIQKEPVPQKTEETKQVAAAPIRETIQKPVEETAAIKSVRDESITTSVAAEINIANETAVEEETEEKTPVAEEPMDELSRLKARLDKVVYVTPQTTAKSQSVVAKQTEIVKPQVSDTGTTADAATGFYTVKKGDTAFGIAKRNNISIQQLRDWNHLNFEDIQVGQKLKVKP